MKSAYRAPAEELSGYRTVVRQDSAEGLPTGLDREKERALPPDSATPNSPAKSDEDSAGHDREMGQPRYNKPDNDIPDRPRTLPEKGEERGEPVKEDYGYVTRRSMTAEGEEFQGDDIEGDESDHLAVKYQIRSWPSKRQRKQRAPKRRKDHRRYVRNRAKLKRYNKVRYRKIKNKPMFKKLRQHQRDKPNRHRRRPPAGPGQKAAQTILPPGEEILFTFPTEGEMEWPVGYVIGADAERMAILIENADTGEVAEMDPLDFLLEAVPLEGEGENLYALVDAYLGPEAYDDIDPDDLDPELVSDMPDMVSPEEDSEGLQSETLDPEEVREIVKTALHAYKPTKTRRRKWRGTKRTKGRRYERRRKRDPRRKQYMKRYNKRRSRNPTVKRIRERRRRNPARWRKRGSVLTTPEIAFVFGPDLKLGYVHSVSPMTGLVTFVMDERDVAQFQSLPVMLFLEIIVPLTEEDADALFDLLEIEIGSEVYEEEITADDIRECAAMYGVDPRTDEFREGCLSLTGKATLEEMTHDERVLVNSAMVLAVMEGGILNRSPEDDFIEDEGEDEEDDENFYYGKVDLPEDEMVRRVVRAWMGTNWQYDQEPPNAHDEIPSTPHRPHQPDSTTNWRREPPDKQSPASGPLDVDSQDAPASSAKAPGGSYVSDGGYIGDHKGKVAATMFEIADRTAQDVHDRAKKVQIRLSRADPKRAIWTFQAKGSKGETYTVRVKALRKGNIQDVSRAQLQVSCSCPFFRWQGPEHWAKANRFLYGRPKGTASKPDIKDPTGHHWACKHVLAAMNMASRYRIGAEGSWWPRGAEIEPDVEAVLAARVAARWLGDLSMDDSE